jgi:small subunit ribosomal protein S8
MSHTDPIADMLTRIRNAIMAEKKSVTVPHSKIKNEIAKVLKKEGYINDFTVSTNEFPPQIEVVLKYDASKNSAIEGISRVSKPGKRAFRSVEDIEKVMGGYGIAVLSTSRGLLTDEEARINNVGGEVLFNVW